MDGPSRVVCLTAETTEMAYALGCGGRVVGVSGYAVRPPEARKKPKVSAFSTAHVARILALKPDLVLGFSDLQADIARDLIRAGVNVLVTNQRTIEETYAAMLMIAGVLGASERGTQLVAEMRRELAAIGESMRPSPRRPRVYFEEWDEPMISGIAWVGEIIDMCGGEDIFPELWAGGTAAERFVSASDVIARDPEVIIASWCGKKARLERIAGRPGWEGISAIRNGQVYEVKAPDILQPGPSLVHGARQIRQMIAGAVEGSAR